MRLLLFLFTDTWFLFQALKARNVILDLLQEHVSIKKEKILKSLLEANQEEMSDRDEESAFDVIIRELILENLR